jgi:hypothetical protein
MDLEQQVTVRWKDQVVYAEKATRNIATIEESLQRGDPKGVYYAKVIVKKPSGK